MPSSFRRPDFCCRCSRVNVTLYQAKLDKHRSYTCYRCGENAARKYEPVPAHFSVVTVTSLYRTHERQLFSVFASWLYCVCLVRFPVLFLHYVFCNRSTCIMVTLSPARNFGCAKKSLKTCMSQIHTFRRSLFSHSCFYSVTFSGHELVRSFPSSCLPAREPGAAPTTLCLWAKMAASHRATEGETRGPGHTHTNNRCSELLSLVCLSVFSCGLSWTLSASVMPWFVEV